MTTPKRKRKPVARLNCERCGGNHWRQNCPHIERGTMRRELTRLIARWKNGQRDWKLCYRHEVLHHCARELERLLK